MNFTLHLTENCNMDCSYCTHEKTYNRMSRKVLLAACDLAFSKGKTAGICFFGGEPLLEKELIYTALDYCDEKVKETGKRFSCKMTTNGTLLDRDFIRRAKEAGMVIGLSFDGSAQDICRRYADGSETLRDVENNVKMLLSEMPMSYAMLTLAPQAVEHYTEAVKYLHSLGFHRVTATIAYGKKVNWTDRHLDVLREELHKLADFYSQLFIKGERFFLSSFDAKIRECISGYNPSERCHLGFRQMPIATSGKIYPCTQFMNDEEYCLGDVFSGIDTSKQLELSKRSSLPKECESCELNVRCTNSCGCLNRLETGDENKISPLQCTYERMLIEICDDMAEKLFNEYPEKFTERFLNV